jgi:hypothetical protein
MSPRCVIESRLRGGASRPWGSAAKRTYEALHRGAAETAKEDLSIFTIIAGRIITKSDGFQIGFPVSAQQAASTPQAG